MPQYMVTMNLTRADPLLSIGRLTDIVRGAILPSLERSKDLQSRGKVLAGGHPATTWLYSYLNERKGSPLSRLQREMVVTVVNGLVGGAP
jgi:hypothetical protein